MRSIGGAVFAAVAFMSSAASAGWGAIAYNSDTGASGQSHGYASEGAASSAALGFCGGGCRVVAIEENSCIALATNSSGA